MLLKKEKMLLDNEDMVTHDKIYDRKDENKEESNLLIIKDDDEDEFQMNKSSSGK